jgi:hypothetical protein
MRCDEIGRGLASMGIPEKARPEELSVAQFLDVYNRFGLNN